MTAIDEGKHFIEHYGVKGQKWGVRKRRNEGERAKTFGRKSKGKKPQEDPLKNLSDKELQQIVQRMNMEQQYKRLSTPQPKPSALKKVLAAGATVNAAIAFARSPAGKMVGTTLASSGVRLVDTSKAVGSIGR